MKHKLVTLVLAVAVIVSLVIGGCVKPAPPAEVVELKLAHHVPPTSSAGMFLEKWAEKVEEATNGGVKITVYPTQTLVKGADFYSSTVDGISDITFGVNVMDASRFPLNSIMDLPVMGWSSPTVASRIWKELFNDFPEVRAEFKEVKVLFQSAGIPRHLHLTKKEARVPEDIKGMKIIATGSCAKAMAALGASPVIILPPDYYVSLERGVVEGVCVDYTVIGDHGVIPLLPYHTDLNLAYLGQELIMNLDTWNSLPPDIQKIIDDLEPWAVEQFLEATDAANNESREACLELNQTIITLTPEELKLWYAGARPVQEKWIADNKAKGLPAQEIYDETQRLIKEYS